MMDYCLIHNLATMYFCNNKIGELNSKDKTGLNSPSSSGFTSPDPFQSNWTSGTGASVENEGNPCWDFEASLGELKLKNKNLSIKH